MLREDTKMPNGNLRTPTPDKSTKNSLANSMISKPSTMPSLPRKRTLNQLLMSGTVLMMRKEKEQDLKEPTTPRKLIERVSETDFLSMTTLLKSMTTMLLPENHQSHHQCQKVKVKVMPLVLVMTMAVLLLVAVAVLVMETAVVLLVIHPLTEEDDSRDRKSVV